MKVKAFDFTWLVQQLNTTDRELHRLALELADDNYDATEDARARIYEARKALGVTMSCLEDAREQLPQEAA